MESCTFCGKPTMHWAVRYEDKIKGTVIGACGDCAGEAFNDAIVALKAGGACLNLSEKKKIDHATILEVVALITGIFKVIPGSDPMDVTEKEQEKKE